MEKKIFALLLIGIIIETGYLLFHHVNGSKNREIITPLAISTREIPTITITSTSVNTIIPKKVSNDELKNIIENIIREKDGDYGIVVKNMQTEEEYIYNGNRQFHPASLYKLWVMATAFQQIQIGRLDNNEVLSQDVNILNSEFNIDPTLAEQTEGTVVMTVKDALEKMITRSDNYAALLLSERLKLSSVSKFLIEKNLMNSKLGEPPVSTPNDIALFLEKLYKGDFANQEKSQEMIELLKKQQLNSKLPKLLKKDIEIAHKTGELESYSHDAGIVFSKQGDYIIVVMSETDNRNSANNVIAQVSKEVYDYFNN